MNFLFLVLLMKTVLRTEQLSRRDGREAVIIGGMVLDIHALPLSPPAPGTTIPGKVSLFFLRLSVCSVILDLFNKIFCGLFTLLAMRV